MPTCRLCNAPKQSQSLRAPHVFGGNPEHQFHECKECSAIYLYPVPSQEDEDRFYKQEFEKYMSTRSGNERDWSNAEKHISTNQDQVTRRWKFLEPHLKPNQDILEIGCSSGFMMEAFKDANLNPIGIEPSGEFLEFLKQRNNTAYETLTSLKQQLPKQKFDIITHFFVFEHIRDPFSFLKNQLALLKPNGKIIAEIPCALDPLTHLYNIPAFEKFYWSIAHHYYYTPKSLKYVLDQLGIQNYEILPEQRYDLSNHTHWMTQSKPGGQGKLNHVFSEALNKKYKEDLKKHWICDTMFLIVYTD